MTNNASRTLLAHLRNLGSSGAYRWEKKQLVVSGRKLVKDLLEAKQSQLRLDQTSTFQPFLLAAKDSKFLAELGDSDKAQSPDSVWSSLMANGSERNVFCIEEKVLREIAHLSSSPEPYEAVAVVMPFPQVFPGAKELEERQKKASKAGGLYLVCDGIRDPGNLGTIMRAAASFGVDGCFLTKSTVDPFHPTVVRSSRGAVLSVPIFGAETAQKGLKRFWDWEDLNNTLQTTGVTKYVASNPRVVLGSPGSIVEADEMGNAREMLDIDLEIRTKGVALVVGNESSGPDALSFSGSHRVVSICTETQRCFVESLNVATASSILLSHLRSLLPL